MNEPIKNIFGETVTRFKSGGMSVSELQKDFEGIFNRVAVDDWKNHEGVARKLVNALEIILFTIPENKQYDAALKVCDDAEAYMNSV